MSSRVGIGRALAQKIGGSLVPFFALSLVSGLVGCSNDEQATEVGDITNDLSGNEIKLKALADPKIEGITCHLTHFDRSLWDRLTKGKWFEDPSNASIACRQTGPLRIGDIDLDEDGEQVFSQRQSLVFKSLIVRRIYDKGNNTLVYIAYSRRPQEGSAKMAVSTVALYNGDVVWLQDQGAQKQGAQDQGDPQ